ncbi:metallophosphoesterase [Schinkia sp. CFF1]
MMVLIFFLLVFVVIMAKIYYDTNCFMVNKIKFHSNKMPQGSKFTILQITDMHNKMFRNHNKDLIKVVKNTKADLIVITGDLIDRRTKNLKNVLHFIENLTFINSNLFFVAGNHEWGNPLFDKLLEELKKQNVRVLNNESTHIIVGNTAINLVGVDDYTTGHGNLKKALSGIRKQQYTLLLSHSPSVIKSINSNSVDLILSGHTHGGQIRFPLLGALIVPDQGLFPKYDKGPFKLGENRYLYIDSGLGTSRWPIRFLNQSQISFITILNENH